MKIGIYNRYWNTCGGGEKYIGTIAETLSLDHDVELIAVEPVDWERIQSRLGIDLSRCSYKAWPNDGCERLSHFSSNYELFINSTYGSSMTPRSAQSVFVCFFPHRIDRLTFARARATRFLKSLLARRGRFRRLNMSEANRKIAALCGVFPVEDDGRAWIGEYAALKGTVTGQGSVSLPLWPDTYEGIRLVMVGGRERPWRVRDNALEIDVSDFPSGTEVTIVITSSPFVPGLANHSRDMRRLGACIDTRSLRWIDFGQSHHLSQPQFHDWKESLSRYDRVISISEFTSKWIQKRWNLSYVELPPPVDTETFSFKDPQKQKLILSVGRFFAGGHNKKHKEIAEAFLKLKASKIIPEEWKLVLAGARHREHPKHIGYFQSIESLCRDRTDILLRPDLPFQDLLSFYRDASIYWHAAGWGEKVHRHPERFEHFGITTCEAMSCECVPIVYDAAGQQEIVSDNTVGFRYSSLDDLSEHMRQLTRMPAPELREIGRRARESVSRYSRSTFPDRVREAFRGICY